MVCCFCCGYIQDVTCIQERCIYMGIHQCYTVTYSAHLSMGCQCRIVVHKSQKNSKHFMCAWYPSAVVMSCPYAVIRTRCDVYCGYVYTGVGVQYMYNLYIRVVCLRMLSYKKKCILCYCSFFRVRLQPTQCNACNLHVIRRRAMYTLRVTYVYVYMLWRCFCTCSPSAYRRKGVLTSSKL